MTTTLITGGTGFIGRAMARACVQRGEVVRILDNDRRGQASLLGDIDVELLTGDVRDPATVARAVEGCERVLHLAAINGTRNFYERPREVLEVGVLGTHHLLEQASRAGVRDFLFMSTSETYQTPPRVPTDETVPLSVPDPRNPRYSYGGSKIAGELMTLHYGGFERALIVRPHNVYGPEMGFDHVIPEVAKKIIDAGPGGVVGLQGGGNTRRAFIHIDDFVRGCLLTLERGESGRIYHVGTEDEVWIRDLAALIADVIDVPVSFREVVSPAGQTSRRCPDTSLLRGLGFEPRVSLRDGLVMTLGRPPFASPRLEGERIS